MELSQGLVKKYVFYNSGLFNKKTGIELMLLNFALILYAGFMGTAGILFSQIGSNIGAGYLTALGYWSLCQLQIISENNVVSLFPIVAGNFEIQKLIILIGVLVIMILGTVLSIIKINH